MAKKKTDTPTAGSAKKTPKKAAAKSAGKPAAQPAPPPPLVDTSLAAEAAARMLLARAKSEPADEQKKGGSLIEQLKADLNRPHSTTVANLLDKSAGPANKRPNLPTGPLNQRGHNQTFGADVNRVNVPRRTGG